MIITSKMKSFCRTVVPVISDWTLQSKTRDLLRAALTFGQACHFLSIVGG